MVSHKIIQRNRKTFNNMKGQDFKEQKEEDKEEEEDEEVEKDDRAGRFVKLHFS